MSGSGNQFDQRTVRLITMHLQHLLPHQLKLAIDEGWPLLVPAGLHRVSWAAPAARRRHAGRGGAVPARGGRVKAVVAPPFWYGPTGYAVTGPDQGTVDVSTERFGRHAKDVLASFWDIGFKWIIICIHHQQLDGPEALALRQAAAEVTFEKTLSERGAAWWGKAPLPITDNVFERIQAWPSVLPAAEKTVTHGRPCRLLRDRADAGRVARAGRAGPAGRGRAVVHQHRQLPRLAAPRKRRASGCGLRWSTRGLRSWPL